VVALTIQTEACRSTKRDTIVARDLVTYSMEGTIYLRNGQLADEAKVYLIKYNAQQAALVAVDSFVISAANGNGVARYRFFGLPAGEYMVKAALLPTSAYYASYLPTYYIRSLHWSSATRINLPAPPQAYNIELVRGLNPGGPSFVPGPVANGANRYEPLTEDADGVALSLYPNPAVDATTLRFALTENVPVQVELFDAQGRAAYTLRQTLPVGAHELALPLADLPGGVYRVRFVAGETQFTAPLLKALR